MANKNSHNFIKQYKFNDRKTIACPIVDGLDWDSLEHNSIYGDTQSRGIWEWGFLYKEIDVPNEELSRHEHPNSEPYR